MLMFGQKTYITLYKFIYFDVKSRFSCPCCWIHRDLWRRRGETDMRRKLVSRNEMVWTPSVPTYAEPLMLDTLIGPTSTCPVTPINRPRGNIFFQITKGSNVRKLKQW